MMGYTQRGIKLDAEYLMASSNSSATLPSGEKLDLSQKTKFETKLQWHNNTLGKRQFSVSLRHFEVISDLEQDQYYFDPIKHIRGVAPNIHYGRKSKLGSRMERANL